MLGCAKKMYRHCSKNGKCIKSPQEVVNLITDAIRGKGGFTVPCPSSSSVTSFERGKKWSRVPVPPPSCFVTRSLNVSLRAPVNGWKEIPSTAKSSSCRGSYHFRHLMKGGGGFWDAPRRCTGIVRRMGSASNRLKKCYNKQISLPMQSGAREGLLFHVNPLRVLHLLERKNMVTCSCPPPSCFVIRSLSVSIRAPVNGWKKIASTEKSSSNLGEDHVISATL
ncbi:hypothetical protein CDAR_120491 [Caerostris darwini]|uniref:Uncharacterized protein n=1 Tax=Caerostris darwini TaxID=1538125 RepID=A0AAV4W8D0_9ARAC|nr:hypothetical protein CDAR_120491 [Caerostris darwini]